MRPPSTAAALDPDHRLLHEGHLHRAERPQRLCVPRPRSGSESWHPPRWPSKPALEGGGSDGEPVELPPGEYPVVFEPQAVGWLLDLLGATAFNGLAHAEGRGPSSGAGSGSAAPRSTVGLARHARTLPRSFDAEGTPEGAAAADPGRGRSRGRARHSQRGPRPARPDRPRAGPRRRPGRPPPHQPGPGRRRRARRGRALLAGGTRHLRDAALVRQRGAAQGDADHGGHPRRHVPDRGRQGHPPPPRPAPDRQRARHPSRAQALARDQS